MPLNWRFLCVLTFGLTGCANFAPVSPSEPAPVPGLEAREALETFPANRDLPADLKPLWLDSTATLYDAFAMRETLAAELNRNATAKKELGDAMTELVDAAWNDGPRPDSLDGDLDPATLVAVHDPALVLELIAPALAEGGRLEHALIRADPQLPRFFENTGGGDEDPGFALYLQAIEREGLNSPLARPLIERMIYIRPLRTMDLMLEHHASSVRAPLNLFGVQQGVRLHLTRQRLGEASPRETLEWMTGVLAPLQGHEQWWVRYYARRLLELQVRRASAAES